MSSQNSNAAIRVSTSLADEIKLRQETPTKFNYAVIMHYVNQNEKQPAHQNINTVGKYMQAYRGRPYLKYSYKAFFRLTLHIHLNVGHNAKQSREHMQTAQVALLTLLNQQNTFQHLDAL